MTKVDILLAAIGAYALLILVANTVLGIIGIIKVGAPQVYDILMKLYARTYRTEAIEVKRLFAMRPRLLCPSANVLIVYIVITIVLSIWN